MLRGRAGAAAAVVAATAIGAQLGIASVRALRAPASTTVVVRLEGNEFRPRVITAHVGDSVRFVNGNGGPHNIAFAIDSISPAAKALLEQAMKGEKIGPVSSPLLIDPQEAYAFVVPALPEGRYPLLCVPHMANMRGELIVSR